MYAAVVHVRSVILTVRGVKLVHRPSECLGYRRSYAPTIVNYTPIIAIDQTHDDWYERYTYQAP